MQGTIEISRIRGAAYNQRVGYVGKRILSLGGGFGAALTIPQRAAAGAEWTGGGEQRAGGGGGGEGQTGGEGYRQT